LSLLTILEAGCGSGDSRRDEKPRGSGLSARLRGEDSSSFDEMMEVLMKLRRERPEIAPGIEQMHPRWEGILRGDHAMAPMQRMYRRFFALFPSPWRCKFCNAPFKGPVAGTLKWVGYSPSAKNPSICAR
jgi:hypothetical protein